MVVLNIVNNAQLLLIVHWRWRFSYPEERIGNTLTGLTRHMCVPRWEVVDVSFVDIDRIVDWLNFLLMFIHTTILFKICSQMRLGIMVFNATFNNISVLLVQGTSPWMVFGLTTLIVIDIDCIGSCKSNYHTITTTTDPEWR